MTEKKIKFTCGDDVMLEGLHHEGTAGCGAVITHPHPLFGGDMYNNVVEAIFNAYKIKGYSTLRFNFRGVGNSTGRYDNGNNEQLDVQAACRFMQETGVASTDLAGYSFGTWINAKVADKLAGYSMVMVSPPAAMLQFPAELKIPGLKLVVTGSADESAPPDLIKGFALRWNPSAIFEVIDGADHFFWGFTDLLASALNLYI